MVKRIVCASVALACWASVAAAQETPRQERRNERREERQPVVEQQPSARGEVQYQDARTAQSYKVKSVIGSKVSIQGGLSIGTVDDIIFDDEGYINYLVVLNEGKYVVVPWQAAKFNFEQRTATVNITQTQFQQVPTFTTQTWPTFDATYNTRIYGYYGLTPRERRVIERRIERRNP
jgi:hypothetical protein